MNFEKQDLRYSYSWNDSDEETTTIRKVRFHDTYTLDINNGEEVLLFINSYMSLKNYSMLCTFHKIENALKKELPETKKGHNKIKRWLSENYFF